MILDHLDALEALLAHKGFPAMSPWWRAQVERFYGAGRRSLVARVGRRGGKSSTLCRIAVLEGLFGEHTIPPGDTGVVAIVSVSRDEASQRLRTVKAILDALGVAYKPIEGGIEIVGRPILFKVFAASIAGVSGFTCICAICDEVAKWRDADTGSNPATEVLASLRPTMATMPSAKLFLSSSPLGLADAHAKAFAEGENAFQLTAYAPTWVANPSVTEAQTRDLERDERVWRREFLAEPQAGVLGAFDEVAVARAFGAALDAEQLAEPVLILDPSSGRKDTWSWAVARWARPKDEGPDVLKFELVDGLEGRFWEHVSGDEIVERVVTLGREWGARCAHADQRESLMLSAAFSKHKFGYVTHDWTASSKPAAVERVRRWFAEGLIVLPEHDKLRRELLAFEERLSPSGALTFGARGSGHDDYVALLLTAAMTDIDGHFPGMGRRVVQGPTRDLSKEEFLKNRARDARLRESQPWWKRTPQTGGARR